MSTKSVHKALNILETIAFSKESRGELSISEISEALELPTSTVSRLLAALVDEGLVVRNPSSRRYGLTLKMADMGESALRRPLLFQTMAVVVEGLARSTQETASLVFRYGHQGLYAYEIPCEATLRASHEVGSLTPLHCTAFGKVLLAACDPSDLETYMDEAGLPEYTRFTITNAYALRDQMEEIRRQGFAIEKNEWELGAGSVAALERDSKGSPTAAIGVTGPVTRLEDKGYETLARQVVLAASELSLARGFKPTTADQPEQVKEPQG
jgi:DNA-binding IclR family transcriptional regulator